MNDGEVTASVIVTGHRHLGDVIRIAPRRRTESPARCADRGLAPGAQYAARDQMTTHDEPRRPRQPRPTRKVHRLHTLVNSHMVALPG